MAFCGYDDFAEVDGSGKTVRNVLIAGFVYIVKTPEHHLDQERELVFTQRVSESLRNVVEGDYIVFRPHSECLSYHDVANIRPVFLMFRSEADASRISNLFPQFATASIDDVRHWDLWRFHSEDRSYEVEDWAKLPITGRHAISGLETDFS